MDANGARFHALWGHAGDWNALVKGSSDVEVADGALRLKSQTPTFEDVSAVTLEPVARRGTARDRFGNWYWVGPSEREILVQSVGTGAVSRFWPPQPEPARPSPFTALAPAVPAGRLAGLAVTGHHALVVGALDPPGLLAFDLAGGGPPRRVSAPRDVPFAPFDLAALGEGVVVLDRLNRAAWAFDRDLAPRPVAPPMATPDPFQPVEPKSPRRSRDASTGADSVALPADWPAALAAESISCDAAWFLHEPGAGEGSLVAKVDWSGALPLTAAPALGTRAKSELKVGEQKVAGHDFALAAPGRLEVALAGGTQVVAFDLAELAALPDFIPLRQFGGLAYVGAAPGDSGGTRPNYDSAGRWTVAAVMPRSRYTPSATLVLPGPEGWDSKIAGTVWHRVFLDACLPPSCSMTIAAEVSEDRKVWGPAAASYMSKSEGAALPWQPVPRRRVEGSELPFAPALPAGFDTWETFLHGARGRYLRLTLSLGGDRTRTPRIRAVRVWYPRFSYVEQYLPAIYRDDASSADFLERFLANVEGMLTGIEDKIVAARTLAGPRTAPAEALDWLTGWLGLTASPGWDAPRKRIFLRHAPTILRHRGTIRGLQWALHLALDESVSERIFEDPRTTASPYRIVETFRRRRGVSGLALGDVTALDQSRPGEPVASPRRWRPEDGPAALNARYAESLGQKGSVPFPLCPPPNAEQAAAWAAFARQVLGFVPEARPGDPDDEARWAAFLRRRYRTDHPPGVPLPATLDVRPALATDWHLFETAVMAAARSAHRFGVLIPAVTSGARATASPSPADLEASRQRQKLAWQVVRREAPAHCQFEVRLYASAFRVGGSRVGADTLVSLGSRAPEFYDDLILDGAFLGEAFLRARPPLNEPGLTVLGQTPTFRARKARGASA